MSVVSEYQTRLNRRMSILGNGVVGFLAGSAVFDSLLHLLPRSSEDFHPIAVWSKLGIAGFFLLARSESWVEKERGLFLGFTFALAAELLHDDFGLAALGVAAAGMIEGIRVMRDVRKAERNNKAIASA